jgi:CrcB protein
VNAGRDGPLLAGLVAVGVGAVFGAWLRWGIGYWLNPRNPQIPYGTLAANLIGGYLVGVAVALFAAHPAVSPFWRLLIITGFLGGLTTFSTFSAENVALLGSGAWGAALAHASLHLFGSLLATAAGLASARALL